MEQARFGYVELDAGTPAGGGSSGTEMPPGLMQPAAPVQAMQDPREMILAAPMSRHQIVAVGVTVALCALDGFNILAVSLAAPGIAAEWHVGKAGLGILFSTSLAGMALGSFLISPLADRIGRRRVIFLSLALMVCGMLLSAVARSVEALVIWRLVTGLGIGAMISVIYPLSAEYSSARRRDLSVSWTAIGYPLGAMVGGAASSALLTNYSWRSVFLLGGGAGLAMAPIVYFALPESIIYLTGKGDDRALVQINRFLARCGLDGVLALPVPLVASRQTRVRELFGAEMLVPTLQVTAINLLAVMSAYYLISWIPQVAADLGFTASQAARLAVTASLGGIVGSIALGSASDKVGLKPLVVLGAAGMGLMIAVFGCTPARLDLLTVVAAIAGGCAFGSITGIYAVLARTFPAYNRATGIGFVVGVGRMGSAVAPAMAGFMLASGLDRSVVSMVMGVPALLAAGIMIAIPVRRITA